MTTTTTEKICVQCKKPFTPKQFGGSQQKCCSSKCSTARYRSMELERKAEKKRTKR